MPSRRCWRCCCCPSTRAGSHPPATGSSRRSRRSSSSSASSFASGSSSRSCVSISSIAIRERRDALARRAVLFLLCTTTIACAILVVPAAPLSRLVTSKDVPGAFRVAVLGIWSFTNLELAQALLRVDERLRAYAIVTLCNVLRDDHRLGGAGGGVRHGLHRAAGRQLRGVDARAAGLVVDDAPASVATTASGRAGSHSASCSVSGCRRFRPRRRFTP